VTEYVLLSRQTSGLWTQEKALKAHSAESAIRSVAASGDWVAIPSRSWKVLSVEVEQIERKTLTPAEASA